MSDEHQAGSSVPIEDLDLSVRAYHCLKREQIDEVADLLLWTREELGSIRNLRNREVREIEAKLRELGFGDLGRGRPRSGTREPRKPRPSAGAGSVALPLPEKSDTDTV